MDNKTRYWILAVSALAIMLSWGRNFMGLTEFFYNYFPGYNKFRTVTMILAIVQITIPLLGLLGLQKLLNDQINKPDVIKALKWALGLTGGFALLFAIMPGAFFDFIKDGEIAQYKGQEQVLDLIAEGRQTLLQKDARRSLFFIILGAAAIWLYSTDKLKKQYAFIAFIVLITFDLWLVAGRYLGPDKFVKETSTEIVASKVDKEILKDKSLHYRTLRVDKNPQGINGAFNDATVSYFHKSIGGYHGAKLMRIQEVIFGKLTTEMYGLIQTDFKVPSVSPILNALNTKYFITIDEKTRKQGLELNQGALGNAWFVPEVKVYENADAEMEALTGFDPLKTATTTTEFESYVADVKATSGTVELIEYKPNYLKYECNANSEGFVVFSEVFYRGNEDWISSIDGKEAEHIRVNYILRGMKVPAGKSTIEFKFDPPTYHTAETFSLISSILLILMLLGGGFLAYKQKSVEGAEAKNV